LAVIDPSNLAENITQVAKAIEQINNQRRQIQYQLQALKKLNVTNWRDIRVLVHQLDILMRQGQALAYSLASLDSVFQETFPGWQVASSNLILPVSQRIQAQRTLGTMRAALNVLAEQARHFDAGQATLSSIKAQMSDIDGTQEALELQATIDAFVAEEIGLLRRTLTAQANMQAVYNAYIVNGQAETRANYRAMVDAMSALPPQSQRTFSLVIRP
jgi:P-type conjugative transfer protein TrbJ